MTINNCLFGAIYLMYKHKTLKIKALWKGRIIPHFYVVKDNTKYHFKVVKDIFPSPFFWIAFFGKYETIN